MASHVLPKSVPVNSSISENSRGSVLALPNRRSWRSAPTGARAYSVLLTHEAIIDSLWIDGIRPVLLQRFPESTEEQLKEAHAYVYGGSIIQDLGYYPFGSHYFSDLVHYVRTGDFLQALLDESTGLERIRVRDRRGGAHYERGRGGPFRLCAVKSRGSIFCFPSCGSDLGDDVSYADDPSSHLKTEFGFDVLQTARGHYASQAYHDFIGFQVSKDLLDRAFQKTYGLTLKDLFHTLDLSLGTYRFSVSRLIPTVTRAAWSMKGKEILPKTSRARRGSLICL